MEMTEDHIVTGEATLQITMEWNGRTERVDTETGDWHGDGGFECSCGETFENHESAADHVWEEHR